MTVTATLRTTETVVQEPHGVVRIDSAEKVYENWHAAKQALDEDLIARLTELEGDRYKLTATQESFKFEFTDFYQTHFVKVQMILNV